MLTFTCKTGGSIKALVANIHITKEKKNIMYVLLAFWQVLINCFSSYELLNSVKTLRKALVREGRHPYNELLS